MAMQVIGQVKLFPTALMGANFNSSFPVDQVDVILQKDKVTSYYEIDYY